MSAFGAKRTCPGHLWSLDRLLMTQSGHAPIREIVIVATAHSGLMLAALITAAHFSTSLSTNFPRYSVDRRSGATST